MSKKLIKKLIEVVGSDCMCELGSKEHKDNCEYAPCPDCDIHECCSQHRNDDEQECCEKCEYYRTYHVTTMNKLHGCMNKKCPCHTTPESKVDKRYAEGYKQGKFDAEMDNAEDIRLLTEEIARLREDLNAKN